MNNPLIVQKIDHGHSVIFMRQDGIIEIDCSDNHEYSVEEIKENLHSIAKLIGSGKALVLNCAKPFTTASKEVRDFVAAAPHQNFIKAEAFVIHNLGQSMLGNFYMKVNKPIVPSKFFKNKREAENWLRSLK